MTFFLTKNAPATTEKRRPDVVQGQRLAAEVKFRPASEKELARIAEQFKALGEDVPEGYVAGWASTANIDLYGHKVVPGAFAGSIREKGITGPRGIKLLIGHDWERVGGVIKVLEYRGDRLWIEAQLNLNISYVRDAYEATKMIGGMNFSVGFMLQDYEFKEDDDGAEFLQINRGDLFEVSIVPFPGNEDCVMEFVKTRDAGFEQVTTISDFEKALVAQGIAKNRSQAERLTRAVKACPHVFLKGQGDDPASDPALSKPAPRLGPEEVNKLSELIEKMKRAISPAEGR